MADAMAAFGESPMGCCIVGGGPAGMMLGYLLGRAGVEVLVLEKHADSMASLQLSMAGVSGIGQTSGDMYIGVGTYKRARIAVAPGLNSFTTDFTLEPTNGCASVPLPVKFRLNFNRGGTLNAAASSVTLGGVTETFGCPKARRTI